METIKKLLFLFSFIVISLGIKAQYLNVLDVYFVHDPSLGATSDTGLTPGDQMVLKFDFRNSLSNQQQLNPGDSISFGWSALGVRIGSLGTRSWPSVMQNGFSAKLYSHEHIPLPKDSCFSWEVCVWPLYNPYAPNTDSTKGNHCTTFKTKCYGLPTQPQDTSKDSSDNKPNLIVNFNELNSNNFFLDGRVLHFNFPPESTGNKIELVNFSGQTVLSQRVSNEGTIDISGDIPNTLYILKVKNKNEEFIKKLYIH